MHKSKVRVRFAPSPTGPLHIGGVRTALYNYLFAKQNQGEFILRIEDTDQMRFVKGAEDYIVKTFEWLGIRFDEGVHIGGPFAPYRQSERNHLYESYALQLIDKGWAYFAFDSAEELDAIRKEYEAEKKIFQYDATTRVRMRNSLTLKKDEVEKFRAEGKPYVIRFMFPEHTEIKFEDLIRGEVQFQSQLLDDKVLFKSDGMPTYHLANVVDDHLMEITHVIRGEEWLPSAPLHIMLYKAFGWEDSRPHFAHLPLLLKPDGNGKLSKRDGDRLGFPVFPLEWKDPSNGETSSGYREQGYFPEAVINILAFLGWNPGSEQEIFSLEELVSVFSLERISKSGAKFDLEKAKWFNHQYLLKMSAEEAADLFVIVLKEKGIEAPFEFVRKVCELSKNRVNFIHELWNETSFFFLRPTEYDPQVIKKRWKEDTATHLNQMISILTSSRPFSKSILHEEVSQYISQHQLNMGQIMNCLRLAIVGEAKGPDLFEIIELLGCIESTQRIQKATSSISPNSLA